MGQLNNGAAGAPQAFEAYEMTAIAIWLNDEEPRHPTLWVAADSRISNTGAALLMEDAAKVFSLPVVC